MPRKTFCVAGDDCPLNYNNITPSSEDWRVVLSFIIGNHQESDAPVFTAEQLQVVKRELKKWSTKVDHYQQDLADYQRINGVVVEHDVRSNSSVNTNANDLTNALQRLDVTDPQQNNVPVGPDRFPTPNVVNRFEHENNDDAVAAPAVVEAPAVSRIKFIDFLENGSFLSMVQTDFLPGVDIDVKRPLGACFDPVRKEFVVADEKNNRLVFLPSQRFVFGDDTILEPSAVCVVEAGKSLAVLCVNSIILYLYDCGSVKVITRSPGRNYYRGLAVTPAGNLLTLLVLRTSVEIQIFTTDGQQSRPIHVIRLPEGKNPSFLDIYGNTLVITDLGLQSVFLCHLDDTKSDVDFAIIKQTACRKWDREGEPHGAFNFVSGVYIDADYQILIADASGSTFQLFNENLEFIHRVSLDFSVYTSSFAINSEGIVMACDRKSSKLVFSKLTSSPEILPIRRGAIRAGGPRGRGCYNALRGRGGGGGRGGFGSFNF